MFLTSVRTHWASKFAVAYKDVRERGTRTFP